MRKHTISYASLFLSFVILLGGCGEGAITGRRSMEPVAVLDYVIPVGVPNIMADINGYSQHSEKYAYLRIPEGGEPVEFFRIRDVDRDRLVYEGRFEPAKVNDDLYKADFTDLVFPGRYRVECVPYGCSEEFIISEDLYIGLADEYKNLIMEQCTSLSASPETVLDFLQAYEWYYRPDRTEGDDLTVPGELTAVRDWISGSDYQDSVGTTAVTYAAILAKFSFLYKDYDSFLATECLQKASSIYSQSGNVVKSDSVAFRALAELYRASGESAYHTELAGYREMFDSARSITDPGYMYGAMTYIVTRQSVDKGLCDVMVNLILSDAQAVNDRRREITDPMYSQTGGTEEMIGYLRLLMCANYILKGYEYDRTSLMMLHYLSGLNVESSVYVPDEKDMGAYFLMYSCMGALEAEGKL
ncbi:MAG: hypothetical protein K5871_11225 [Lachnospiraceae bacterium]|nr:hypothetical protein [Lachnospiraceae bacterium]